MVDKDHQGNLTAATGLTAAEQKYTLASLLLAVIDYPEDVPLHLQRAILHIKDGPDLISANKRLTDAAARLQVMQLPQYNTFGNSDRCSEKVMSELLENVKGDYDYIIIIGLCTLVCNGEDFSDMEEFRKQREEWLRGFLELPHCIPDSDTFR